MAQVFIGTSGWAYPSWKPAFYPEKLAQTRYKMGLSSIVELSQAQLQQTQAQLSYVQAGYDYRLAQATLSFETKGL